MSLIALGLALSVSILCGGNLQHSKQNQDQLLWLHSEAEAGGSKEETSLVSIETLCLKVGGGKIKKKKRKADLNAFDAAVFLPRVRKLLSAREKLTLDFVSLFLAYIAGQ